MFSDPQDVIINMNHAELLKISTGRAAAPEKDIIIPHDLDDRRSL
jgi:hypothetical protein